MSHEICFHVCEVCGRQYVSKDNADLCEIKHFKPTGLIKMRHEFYDEKYPNVIDVQLRNYDDTLRVWGEYKLNRRPLIPGVDYPMFIMEKQDATS